MKHERKTSMSFQQVTLLGRVTKQGVTARSTDGGQQVANLTVSTVNTLSKKTPDGKARTCPEGWTESRNGKSWEVRTYWRVTAWGRSAEFTAEYVKPGDMVFVAGEMKGQAADGTAAPRIWQDKEGGSHADYEVTASVLKAWTTEAPSAAAKSEEEEELPF
jgi:single-stranded DNA-binding protein